MSAILSEIITLLTGGITSLGQAIGASLSALVEAMFVTTGTGGAKSLSTYGGMVIIFAGIGLAIGLCTRVFTWLTSLGN